MAKKKKEEAEESTETEVTEGGEGDGEGAPKKGKKKLLFIIIGVVALIAIGAGLFFSGVLGGSKKKGDAKEEEAKESEATDEHGKAAAKVADKPVYYELPQFLVNLNAGGTRTSFLKMSVTLELRDQSSVGIVEANKPRIVDVFNTFLRELRPADVQGSAGIYHLRDELMARLNATIQEGLVKDILFSEIIVQ